jgi:hypothetical protein
LNGKAPKGSDQVFRLIVDGMRRQVQDAQLAQPPSDAPFGPAQAQALSSVLIKRLSLAGF